MGIHYYRWYFQDFLGGRVVTLSFYGRAMYRDLLDLQWKVGYIPKDPAEAARQACIPLKIFNKEWPEVSQFFIEDPTDPNKLINPRAAQERAEAKKEDDKKFSVMEEAKSLSDTKPVKKKAQTVPAALVVGIAPVETTRSTSTETTESPLTNPIPVGQPEPSPLMDDWKRAYGLYASNVKAPKNKKWVNGTMDKWVKACSQYVTTKEALNDLMLAVKLYVEQNIAAGYSRGYYPPNFICNKDGEQPWRKVLQEAELQSQPAMEVKKDEPTESLLDWFPDGKLPPCNDDFVGFDK